MECPFCNKTIAKKDAYCRHCGKRVPDEAKAPSTSMPWPPEEEHHEDEGVVLARVYRHILGDKYMAMISRLYELNPEKAIAMMREDVGYCLRGRPKKTREEIRAELADFFNDPVTRQKMGKQPIEEAPK
jgi:hypothetical protein